MKKTIIADEYYDNFVDYSIVNSNIRKYREKAELTQAQLAEKSHISTKYLSRLENNHYKGRLHVYVQIAIALDITLYDLIGNAKNTEDDFLNQLNLLTQNITDNKKKMLLENLKTMKNYDF
ncbi:helix-turn-helix domain-containing protein [Acetivibrio sp. MSJd-27]|uniref:helix-turn-helix domain-containing protein n=1 Tax=Acetivibrio sp. MSJd-27 TaxID=2841523 RepID=UPI0015AE8C96|nr:helix-turn-helix transcriptional regulator [Acetivibrio sp. MSJd-27]MBU5448986.1 helix-turn-helix transcriptional regulator [Acetivibrio sp. MSJd-27]